MPLPKLAAFIVFLLSANVYAATNAFHDRLPDSAVDTASLNAPLQKYRAFTMDIHAVRSQLADAPDERSSAPASTLDLPLADGTTQRFNVWRTQVMATQLAARYPQIRSYVARAADHPEIEARLDDSPHGFSAMIRRAEGVTMVQPVRSGDARYITFRRDDIGASSEPFRCLEDNFANSMRSYVAPSASAPQTTTGANVRTYRLALAATGEYTAVFGGTVADGMAAIVQAINRVNGIYLTEFAVQFQLVNNNDQLVYTDATTDPYANGSGNTMLGQNQTNIDAVIGSANYDFGHVFSTGGGGVAFVGVACNGSYKARGVTGSSSPVGDAFWVDYVAHEMGHQMGADHSFNTLDGFCSGNRASSQATEPGSGSTIMAYAGICGPSDLQPHSDPFFHAVSLVPIEQTLTSSGAACGTVLTTTNHAPVVNPVSARTVPAQTPFALVGSASDADADPLTYVWEEMDLGAGSPPEGDNGHRPLFRSFVPIASPTRLVPELPRILSHDLSAAIPPGGNISGESWATTTRDLKFRLTVRDNHPGGGASASTDAVVHVTATAGPFRVTAPATGTQWIANAQEIVSWDVANTTAAPVSCASVDILYSSDGGQTFAATLASNVPNSGTTTLTSPNIATTMARIEVACHDNIFFDVSPANFSIITDDIFTDGFETID